MITDIYCGVDRCEYRDEYGCCEFNDVAHHDNDSVTGEPIYDCEFYLPQNEMVGTV